MPGIRLQSKYLSEGGRKYRIDVIDMDASTDALIDFDMNDDAVEIKRNGKDTEPFYPIVSTEVSWTMEVNTAAHLSFYDDLINSLQGRFIYELYVEAPGDTMQLEHRGIVLPNITELEDRPDALLAIKGVCGINNLRSIDFNIVTPFLHYTWVEMLTAILKEIKTEPLYSDTDRFLTTSTGWQSSEHVTTSDMLTLVRSRNIFYKENEKTKAVIYDNCLDVLKMLLTQFNARIYAANGHWIVEQIGEKTDGSEQYDTFTKLGTSHSRFAASLLINSNARPASLYPRISHLPPIRSVIIKSDDDFRQNILFDNVIFGSDFNNDVKTTTYTLSQASVDLEERLTITWRHRHYYNQDPFSITPLLQARYKVTITVGSYTLRGVLTQGVAYGYYIAPAGLFWSQTVNPVDDVVLGIFAANGEGARDFGDGDTGVISDTEHLVRIVTPPVPATGPVTIDIELLPQMYRYSVSSGAIYASTDVAANLYWRTRDLQILVNNINIFGQFEETVLVNDPANSEVEEIEVKFGDYPGTSSSRKLEVWDGAGWVDSLEWKGTFVPLRLESIILTIIRERLEMRKRPQKLLEATFDGGGVIDFNNVVQYGTDLFIPLRLVHNTGYDSFTGTWWHTAKAQDNSTPTATTTDLLTESFTSQVNGLVFTEGFVKQVNNVYPIYHRFDSVTGDEVDLGPVGFALPDDGELNRGRLQVVVSGIEYTIYNTMPTGRSERRRACVVDAFGQFIEFGIPLTGQDVVLRQLGAYIT